MNEYIVLQPFSLAEKVVVVRGDLIYGELVRKMYHVYSSKTKRYLGKVSEQLFTNSVIKMP